MTGVKQMLSNSAVIAQRNVIKITRVPEVLVFVLLSPIMFVLMFSYVFGNIPDGTPEPTVWSLQNPELYTLLWVCIIVAVFAPLSVRRYNGSSRR